MPWGLFISIVALLQGLGLYLDNFHFDAPGKERIRTKLTALFLKLDQSPPGAIFGKFARFPLLLNRPVGAGMILRTMLLVLAFWIAIVLAVTVASLPSMQPWQVERMFDSASWLPPLLIFMANAVCVTLLIVLPVRYILMAFSMAPTVPPWRRLLHRVASIGLAVLTGFVSIIAIFPAATVAVWFAALTVLTVIYHGLRYVSLITLERASAPHISPFSYAAATLNIFLLILKVLQEWLAPTM